MGEPQIRALYGQQVKPLALEYEPDGNRDRVSRRPADHTDLDLAVAGEVSIERDQPTSVPARLVFVGTVNAIHYRETRDPKRGQRAVCQRAVSQGILFKSKPARRPLLPALLGLI